MGYEIEHQGILIEAHVTGGSPGRYSGPPESCYPAESPDVEIEGTSVSDWDEFAAWHGAKGERPIFAPTLESLIERIIDRDIDKIVDDFLDTAANDEPDFDEPDDYDDGDYLW